MKEFVGKIGGMKGDQQALKLRTLLMDTLGSNRLIVVLDTELTEALMRITQTEEFNKNLEAQQNLVAGYDTSTQLSNIEDLMYQQIPWQTVLRSVILMSLTTGGIKPKNLEVFKRDFLQVYGYHHLPLLINLQSLNLLVRSPSLTSQNFPALRKSLRLLVDDINDAVPNDISYVYSGYAPLSIRLVQCVTQKNVILSGPTEEGPGRQVLPKAHRISGWKGFEDVLAGIPGSTVDVKQKVERVRSDMAGKCSGEVQ